MSRLKKYLEIGQIVGTHGVRGEVRVQPWCDSPSVMSGMRRLYWDADGKADVAVQCRPHQRMVLAKLKGVDTVEAAAALRGRVLYAARRDIPLEKGRYFICDLIGLQVRDADDGTVYGDITDVTDNGANNVYPMRHTDGREILVPAIPDIIVKVAPEEGYILLRPMKGLFDDAD